MEPQKRVKLPWYNLCILHQGHKNYHWMNNKEAERKLMCFNKKGILMKTEG